MHACAACARSGATTARACRGGVSGPERHGDHEDDRHDPGECRHHGRRRPGGVRAGRRRRSACGAPPCSRCPLSPVRRRSPPGCGVRRPGTTVHFRVVVTTAAGQVVGADQAFTTVATARASQPGTTMLGVRVGYLTARGRAGTRARPLRPSARLHLARQALEGDAEAARRARPTSRGARAGAGGRGRGCALDPGRRSPSTRARSRNTSTTSTGCTRGRRGSAASRASGARPRLVDAADRARGADAADGVDHHPHACRAPSGRRSSCS